MKWSPSEMKRRPIGSADREPLYSVSEIAEALDISRQALTRALQSDGAPSSIFNGKDHRYLTKPARVLYRLATVVKWYREVYVPSSPSDKKLEHERTLKRERDRRYRERKKAKVGGEA
jgi:hypothetical protein